MGSSVPHARFILRKIWNNFGWMGFVAQMQTLPFTYTLLPWVHEPWAYEIIFLEGHECYCAKKENGGVGKQTWKPFSKLSPYKTDNIFLNSLRISCLIFLWSCCRLVQGRYTTVCLAGRLFVVFIPFSAICCKCMILNDPQINILQH